MFRPLFVATFILALLAADASANYCPRVMQRATRLVIITVPDMNQTKATMHTFERASPAAVWARRTEPEPVVVGARGIGWGPTFSGYARKDEPAKREGDQRTPAGIYRLAATFSFTKESRAGHLQLVPGKQFCVRDASSPQYGRIVEKGNVSEMMSGEDMASFPLYKRGIVIDYPPHRGEKGGSCIFLHVWGGEGVGTAGCVAMPEERVEHLQSWVGTRLGVIAIVSESAVERFKGCLPLTPTALAMRRPPPCRCAIRAVAPTPTAVVPSSAAERHARPRHFKKWS